MKILEEIDYILEQCTDERGLRYFDAQGNPLHERLYDFLNGLKATGYIKDFSVDDITVFDDVGGEDGVLSLAYIDADGKLEHQNYVWTN